MAVSGGIKIEDIKKAQEVVAEVARKTPMIKSVWSPKDSELYLKLENTQVTGSFKIRGAYNKLKSLTDSERKQGVIASSAGNHAQGVARSAQKLGIDCKIVMPLTAPLVKVEGTKSYGAKVVLYGDYFDEAYKKAKELAEKEDRVFIHPFEDDKVIVGQGTIGLEMVEAIPELDYIVIPIGGGGLISGIATAVKTLRPECKIYGVVSRQAPGMLNLKMGKSLYQPARISTLADGIAVKNTSQAMFDTYVNELVDEIVAVSDDEIAAAIVHLLEKEKTVTEGSGAAAFAALLSGVLEPKGKGCAILCGGNIDINTISSVIERGLRESGRWTRISVVVDDLPGTLAKLTEVVANYRANVLDVIHDRADEKLSVRQTRIDFLLETASALEIGKIIETLTKEGIRVL